MPLQAVENRRLYRQIADQIAALITQRRVRPGRSACRRSAISRSSSASAAPSVREALIALEVEGYVEVRVGSGVYVTRPAARDADAAHARRPTRARSSSSARAG